MLLLACIHSLVGMRCICLQACLHPLVHGGNSPGHPANSGTAMGFCLYNNVAVATAALRMNGGPSLAIIDFDPDFILVSAGFDAHAEDPLAGLKVTTPGFAKMVEMLVNLAGEICDGKIVFTLEGGYDPSALAACLKATAAALK